MVCVGDLVLEKHRWTLQVIIYMKAFVIGNEDTSFPSETSRKAQAIGVAKKRAFSQAFSAAFSRVILCTLPSGKVGAHVIPSCDPSRDEFEILGES